MNHERHESSRNMNYACVFQSKTGKWSCDVQFFCCRVNWARRDWQQTIWDQSLINSSFDLEPRTHAVSWAANRAVNTLGSCRLQLWRRSQKRLCEYIEDSWDHKVTGFCRIEIWAQSRSNFCWNQSPVWTLSSDQSLFYLSNAHAICIRKLTSCQGNFWKSMSAVVPDFKWIL